MAQTIILESLAVPTGGTRRYTADAAISTRNLLYQQGATDGGVAVNIATTCPLGTVDNTVAITEAVTVLLLGKESSATSGKIMVANEAISAGEQVFTAAAGKVQDTPAGATVYLVGTALTAALADGDELIVQDCVPVKMVFA